jgi:hypothetical protein
MPDALVTSSEWFVGDADAAMTSASVVAEHPVSKATITATAIRAGQVAVTLDPR